MTKEKDSLLIEFCCFKRGKKGKYYSVFIEFCINKLYN